MDSELDQRRKRAARGSECVRLVAPPRQSPRGARRHIGIALLLAVFVAIGLYYLRANPPFEAPEEALHLAVVRDIASGRQPPFKYVPAQIGEEQQPRAYYLLLTFPVGWADGSLAGWIPAPMGLQKGPGLALLVGRLETLLLFGIGSVLFTYLLILRLFRSIALALATSAFQMLIPGFMLTSSTVNNDNAVNFFGSLALLLGAAAIDRPISPWRIWLLYALCIAAAALSKLTALFIVPYFIGTMLIIVLHHRSRRLIVVLASTLLAATAAVLAAALLDPQFRLTRAIQYTLTNRSVYSPANIWWALTNNGLATTVEMAGQLARTSLDIAGWENSLPAPEYVYAGSSAIAFLALLGLARYVISPAGWRMLRPQSRHALVLLCLALSLVLVQLYLVGWGKPYTRYHWGITHARYLFPVLGVASLLTVGGLASLLPRYSRAVISILLAALLLLSLSRTFYRTSDTSRALFNDIAAPAARVEGFERLPSESVSFAAGVSLMDWVVTPATVTAGGTARVRLLWRADVDQTYDYRALVHVLDLKGEKITGSDSTPSGYRFPTRLWRRGDVVLDDREVSIPASSSPGRYSIVLGVYAFDRQDKPVLSIAKVDGIETREPRYTLGYVQIPQPPLPLDAITAPREATFGETVRLLGSSQLASPIVAGQPISVTLFWQAWRPIHDERQISIQVLDPSGRLVAQQDGQPQNGSYPMSIWRDGEIVPDTHVVDAPPYLLPGRYSVIVVVYGLANQQRIQVREGSNPPADAFRLGEFTVNRK